MRVLVCVKRVPAPGGRIPLTEDRQDVDASFLGFTMSPHEECAVEEAARLVKQEGGEVTVLTLGPKEAEEQLRYAISIKANKAAQVVTDTTDWDPQRTAAALAEGISTLEAEEGVFDLVLFGNESADSGGFQVGVRVANHLGRPMVNGIKALEPGEGKITARRPVEGGFEEYELPLPAMVGVKEGINLPSYPTMKGRLASKRAVVTPLETTAEVGGQRKLELVLPAEEATETSILGHGPEAAPKVVEVLAELGVL